MIRPSAPIEAVSSQRSEEIKPKAGIASPNTRGQFAPKEKFIVIDKSVEITKICSQNR